MLDMYRWCIVVEYMLKQAQFTSKCVNTCKNMCLKYKELQNYLVKTLIDMLTSYKLVKCIADLHIKTKLMYNKFDTMCITCEEVCLKK